MVDGEKRCPRCELVKALEEFHQDRARADGLQLWCKACCRERDRARPRQRRTVRRVLRVRANNRAMAALRRAHPDEFDALYDEALAAVLEQHENFLAAKAPEPADVVDELEPDPVDDDIPLLRSGPAVPGEPIEARLLPAGAPASCDACRSRHERDHRCPVCGSKPQLVVQVGAGRVMRGRS